MMDDIAVGAWKLSKRFKLYTRPWHRAAEWFSLGRSQRHSDFWALKDVSFRLKRGECLGIIGPNGAGKTTLLKILSRALYPTQGNFEVKRRAVSLLELGTGFNLELTGIQNIFNSARLLGFSDSYVKTRVEAIVEFAELGDFIERPLHIYSSGMFVRLAFSLFACLVAPWAVSPLMPGSVSATVRTTAAGTSSPIGSSPKARRSQSPFSAR